MLLDRPTALRVVMILSVASLLCSGGCSIKRVAQPKPPQIQVKANLYERPDYQNDINAYNAAAEGTISCASTSGQAGDTAKLAFCSTANGAADSTLAGSVVVQIQDADGKLVTADTKDSITISSNPDGGAFKGTLTVTAVKGVATFSTLSFGAPNTYVLTAEDTTNTKLLKATSNPVTVVAAGTAPSSNVGDPERARYFRNKIAYNYMGEIDYVYGEYSTSLFTGKSTEAVIADSMSLGLTAASTISLVAQTKTILSALATATTGTTLSVDKNFFAQQAFQSLAIAMQARRDKARKTILDNLQLGVADYPLSAVRRDLISYFYAGTLPAALQEIQQEAAAASTDAGKSPATTNQITAPCAGTGGVVPAALVFCSQPTTGVVGTALTPVVVQVQDAHGNSVASFVKQVTVTVNPSDSGFTGTLMVNAVAGVATFSDLKFSTSNTFTLTVSATGLPNITSNPLKIASAGAAAAPPVQNAPNPAPAAQRPSSENLH